MSLGRIPVRRGGIAIGSEHVTFLPDAVANDTGGSHMATRTSHIATYVSPAVGRGPIGFGMGRQPGWTGRHLVGRTRRRARRRRRRIWQRRHRDGQRGRPAAAMSPSPATPRIRCAAVGTLLAFWHADQAAAGCGLVAMTIFR